MTQVNRESGVSQYKFVNTAGLKKLLEEPIEKMSLSKVNLVSKAVKADTNLKPKEKQKILSALEDRACDLLINKTSPYQHLDLSPKSKRDLEFKQLLDKSYEHLNQ
jgi:hypothetical protein